MANNKVGTPVTSAGFIASIRRILRNAGGSAAAAAKRLFDNTVKTKSLALPEFGRLAEFEAPGTFSFDTITSAYSTESLVRQAIDKYVDLMFKAGWDITGKNQAAVDYIKMRLALIAEGTGIPTEQLLIDIAEDLILYHNVFVFKVRQPNTYSWPPGVKVSPINNNLPVVGYFPLPVNTITIKRNPNGMVMQYQQTNDDNSKTITIKPADLVHLYVDKPKGRGFGVPFLTAVIDDIKILRILEEMVAKLIYKELFPIYMYKVGLNKEGMEGTEDEIEAVRTELNTMPMDGMIVASERHNLEIIGTNGKVMDMQPYLQYFQQRVYTGLGMSDTLMGQGSSSSRSTADNLTVQLHDRVKAYQKIMAMFFNTFIIRELLIEGGFDAVMNPLDDVTFRFKEIDLDNKVKLENQAIQKFAANAITHEELRAEIGLDPVTDENRLAFKMVQAFLDAQAAAASAQNAVAPQNQHSTSASSTVRLHESYRTGIISACSLMPKDKIGDYISKIDDAIESAKSDIIDIFSKNASDKSVEMALSMTNKYICDYVHKYANSSFFNAVNGLARNELDLAKSPFIDYSKTKAAVTEKFITFFTDLIEKDMAATIRQSDKTAAAISSTFDLYADRIAYTLRDVGFFCYNQGVVNLARKVGAKEVFIKNNSENSDCSICQTHKNTRIIISDDLSAYPPYHNHCTCILTFKRSPANE